MENRSKIYWHEAFFEALQLEFNDYLHLLEFENEHQLSKEALIMDVLIIKKKQEEVISKNIGQIFKSHNIVEFKSEADSLSWKDYNKVVAYGLLYSAFNGVKPKDITITFAVTMHPRAVLEYLQQERGFVVSEHQPGMYYVNGDSFGIQILESKKLRQEENLFLRNLRSNLTVTDAQRVAAAYKDIKAFEKRNAYLDRLLEANADTFKEMMKMSESLANTLHEITKDSPYWQAIVRRESMGLASEMAGEMAGEMANKMAGEMASKMASEMTLERIKAFAKKLLTRGLSPEDIAEDTGLPLEVVMAL